MNKILFAPTDNGDTGGGDSAFDDMPIGDDNDVLPSDDSSSDDKVTPAKSAPAAPAVDVEAIAQAIARGMHSAKPQDQAPPLTQAEVDRLMNRYSITEDTLKAIGFSEPTPEQIKGFQSLFASVDKHHNTVASVMVEAVKQELSRQIAPALDYIQQQRVGDLRNQFFSKYKNLEKYEPIVRSVASVLSERKANGSTKSLPEMMEEAANETKRILRESGINLDNDSNDDTGASANLGAPQARRTNGAVPEMASLSGGGRSSTSGARGKANDDQADIYRGWFRG